MPKRKVVYYIPSEDDTIVKEYPACVFPVNHPGDLVSNKKYVITSKVQTVYRNGEFETENTHYIPLRTENVYPTRSSNTDYNTTTGFLV